MNASRLFFHTSKISDDVSDLTCDGTFNIPNILEHVHEFVQVKQRRGKKLLSGIRRFGVGNTQSGRAKTETCCSELCRTSLDDCEGTQANLELERPKFGFLQKSANQQSVGSVPVTRNFLTHLRIAGAGAKLSFQNCRTSRRSTTGAIAAASVDSTPWLQRLRATRALLLPSPQHDHVGNLDMELPQQLCRPLQPVRRCNRTTQSAVLNAAAVAHAILTAKMWSGTCIDHGSHTNDGSIVSSLETSIGSGVSNKGFLSHRHELDDDGPSISPDLLLTMAGDIENTYICHNKVFDLDMEASSIGKCSDTVVDFFANDVQEVSLRKESINDDSSDGSTGSNEDVLSDLPENQPWQQDDRGRSDFRGSRIYTDDSLLSEMSDLAFKDDEITLRLNHLKNTYPMLVETLF